MPRWPASEICPREVSTWAVGVRLTKSWNRRPLIGRFAMAVESSVVLRVSLVVSTRAAAPSTVTASATPATPNRRSTVTLEPTVTTTAGRLTVWKPVSWPTTS